ncbi:hypothetical protein VCCP10303_2861, partial [Vibrio cholerae CP1030(3)]
MGFASGFFSIFKPL